MYLTYYFSWAKCRAGLSGEGSEDASDRNNLSATARPEYLLSPSFKHAAIHGTCQSILPVSDNSPLLLLFLLLLPPSLLLPSFDASKSSSSHLGKISDYSTLRQNFGITALCSTNPTDDQRPKITNKRHENTPVRWRRLIYQRREV